MTAEPLLRPATAREEDRRLYSLTCEELGSAAFHEYCVVLDEVKAKMGNEFLWRLENAVMDRVLITERQILDRLVIGVLDSENVSLEELRTTRRTAFVPTFDLLTPNSLEASEANCREEEVAAHAT